MQTGSAEKGDVQMDPSIWEAKQQIRRQVLEKRKTIDLWQKKEWDEKIITSIMAHPVYEKASTVMLYMAMPQEVNLDLLVEASITSGKKVGLPRVDRQTKTLHAHHYGKDDQLVAGVFGIREPDVFANEMPASEFDLLIMPGLAFGEKGERIGYGGGYYDRFIQRRDGRPFLLAVAYDWQVYPELPSTTEDKRIDGVVTPTRVITF